MEDNLLYVPLDDLMRWYGVSGTWTPETLTYALSSTAFQYDEAEIKVPSYTDEDLLWLARIVDVETGDATVFKRMAVANVVLNRVKSERFPNTIYEVIFQSGQFPPSKRDSFPTLTPKANSMIAAKRALEGENNIETCLFFNNRPFSSKSDDFYQLIEGDYFYN
ncbi:cell wall hydrolase [Fusibacter paucivorans]|uniref:Cell wall hydrolase n=2 Tax=Fusibacter paucivorans TaxID=76009 RepID=A0ABS5PRK5_9FIRM|nr:cell wall hydrolase [Fusibacter paucivorans]